MGYELPTEIGLFNFSELQNEEKVSIKLYCMGGYFKDTQALKTQFTKEKYQTEDGRINNNFTNVLHYVTPATHKEIVITDKSILAKKGGKLLINLIFGGKYSPAKSSDYLLDFNGSLNLNNLNSMLELCQ
jgi:predicted proteasome-type protease